MSQKNDKPADQDERLEKLELALEKAQAKLADQNVRLDALGSGREESMRLLNKLAQNSCASPPSGTS